MGQGGVAAAACQDEDAVEAASSEAGREWADTSLEEGKTSEASVVESMLPNHEMVERRGREEAAQSTATRGGGRQYGFDR